MSGFPTPDTKIAPPFVPPNTVVLEALHSKVVEPTVRRMVHWAKSEGVKPGEPFRKFVEWQASRN
jgi:hypothetical protein